MFFLGLRSVWSMYERTISAKEHTERSLGAYLGTPKFMNAFARTVGGKNVVISPEGNFSYDAPLKSKFLNRLTNGREVRVMQRWQRTSPTTFRGSIHCSEGNVLIEVALEVFPQEENSIMYTALRITGTSVRTSLIAPRYVVRAAMDDFTDALETMLRPKGHFGVCAHPEGPGCVPGGFYPLSRIWSGKTASRDT